MGDGEIVSNPDSRHKPAIKPSIIVGLYFLSSRKCKVTSHNTFTSNKQTILISRPVVSVLMASLPKKDSTLITFLKVLSMQTKTPRKRTGLRGR